MVRALVTAALVLLTLFANLADAAQVRGYTRKDGTYVRPHYRSAPGSSAAPSVPSETRPLPSSPASGVKCPTCPRDAHGRIDRDEKALREFQRTHPKPAGCPDCEVDHIIPLHRGGPDHPSNMQWLPAAVHREKTRREARP
ncbi:MAG: HNH endonuclease signature motif containing protein [Candidatus Methylomirabilales bacterium]